MVGPAWLRTGKERIPAVLGVVREGHIRLGLREVDALWLRDRAASGERLAWVPRAGGGGWRRVRDLRLGRGYGGGANAVRTLEVVASGAVSSEGCRPLVAALDGGREIACVRAVAHGAGLEVVSARALEDRDAEGALVLGGEPAPANAWELVRRFSGMRALVFAPSGVSSPEWEELLDSGRVYFACGGCPEPEVLSRLLRGAAEEAWLRRVWRELCPREETEDGLPAFAWYDAALLSRRRAARRVLGDLGAQAERKFAGMKARVLALDEWAEGLIGARRVEDGVWADSPVAGLTALALRAGVVVREERGRQSVFFDADLDRPPGCGPGLVAAPVRDLAGTAVGVLAVSPLEGEDEPGLESVREIERFAAGCAVPLVGLREEGREVDDSGLDRSLFRAEAIEEHRRAEAPSAILNVSEQWGRWIVGGLAAFLLVFGLFLVFGKASEHAEGNAVVRGRNQAPVVANAGGTVSAVRLAPGAEVAAGEVIGTLYGAVELAEVERLEHEYEDALVRLLRNPEDPGAGASLPALRGASEAARAALDQRQLTAPVAGVLADIRVRVGTLVSPGQTVATIHTAGAGFEIVAGVPGNFRPLLWAGMPVVAELEQFPGSRFHLEASFVNPEVVAPEEARALAGPLLMLEADGGPVALVHAQLPQVLVSSTGEEFPLFDGMRGSVRIPVREQRFIVSLWPALGR